MCYTKDLRADEGLKELHPVVTGSSFGQAGFGGKGEELCSLGLSNGLSRSKWAKYCSH